MSSLSEMWSNPITRNQRRTPPNERTSRSKSGDGMKGGRILSIDIGGGRATTPTPEHRRRHSTMAPRNSRHMVRSGSEKNFFHLEGGRDLRSPFPAEFATVVEEIPPPSLPILNSSSGSEDEGFGPDDEMLVYKLRLLNATPKNKARSMPHVAAPATSQSSRHPRSPSMRLRIPPHTSSVRTPRLLPSPTPPSFPSPMSNFSEPGEPWMGSADNAGSNDRNFAGNRQRQYFSSSLLQGTLALIRSGQMFCDENHMAVDFVRRAEIIGRGAQAQARTMESDALRHALLVTDAALYMLAVQMFPRTKSGGEPGRRKSEVAPSTRPRTLGQPMSARRGVTWAVDHSSTSPEPVRKIGVRWEDSAGPGDRAQNGGNVDAETRGSSASGGGGGGGSRTREKRIRSIQMVARWVPDQLSRVLLPFREVPLKNGDVVARRGCSIVLHTRVRGKFDHVWLRCRSNQDRGALVEVLVRWYEAKNPDTAELNVQQVPEAPLLAHLARRAERAPNASGRLKDTDCVIS